jgi:phosphatidylglycerophosphatase A
MTASAPRRPWLALALATAGGAGYAPVAPGTFGTAVGLALWALLPPSDLLLAVVIVGVLVAGVWAGNVAERHFGESDPGPVVIDEVAGMLITLWLNPVDWRGALAGFVLFRITDIVKPYPANRLEQLRGGYGVMADDTMAAVYANLALRLMLWAGGASWLTQVGR